MQFRKFGLVVVVLVMLAASLSGCMMADQMEWPDRAVDVNLDAALAGQDAAIAGLMMGSAMLDESQLSSVLTYLIRQNNGENFPVDTVTVWLAPENQVYIEVAMKDGVLLGDGKVRLSGSLAVENQQIVLDVDQASANGVAVSGPLLDMVSAQINNALADPSLGVLVDVTTDEGMITLSMGM
jgi:hypothetical protein